MKKNKTRIIRGPGVFLLGIWVAVSFSVVGQDTISLDYCYKMAEKNWPLTKQVGMLNNTRDLKISNLNKSYLPQFNVGANVSVQSDVTQVAIVLPVGLPELTMPVIPKDWYKLTVDINQVIYDGNVTRYQKKVEEFGLRVDQKSVEIELYKLKDRDQSALL